VRVRRKRRVERHARTPFWLDNSILCQRLLTAFQKTPRAGAGIRQSKDAEALAASAAPPCLMLIGVLPQIDGILLMIGRTAI
jgi:hypothetical protein